MTAKPVLLRELAVSDIDEAISYYVDASDEDTALRFVDSVRRALDYVGRHPASGSPRYAHELDLPGLRCWPLTRFPYVVFYVERDDHVDVWRVLHTRRDIPSRLQPDHD